MFMYRKAKLLKYHFFLIWFIKCKRFHILLACNDKLMVKFIWKCKECRLVYTILIKENKVGWFILPDTKICSKAIVIQTVGHWHKERHKYKHITIKLCNFSLSYIFSLPLFFPPSQLGFLNSKCILISSVDPNASKEVLLYFFHKALP